MKNKTTTLVIVIIILANKFRAQDNFLISNCIPATAQADLDINNVRARVMTGGDLWWDLVSAAKYEVPKGSAKHSLFAGGLWIGGYDPGGNLKLAAMTYRQTGNDFWPGPLTSATTTDGSTCLNYDKFWKINRSDVQAYYNWIAVAGGIGPNPVSPSAMNVINTWPAFDPGGQPMAPFFDANSDGAYDPATGDYPAFDLNGNLGCGYELHGDQVIWWVFNDKGNSHTETGGDAIGLEIQAQAFAFATNDDLNNTTFYKYKVINSSSFSLNQTFFGQWIDPDLGNGSDDYVGCDVTRGLGYCYNANATDGIYGSDPPAIGIDFMDGPFADANDNIDNDRDGTVDEPNEKIMMSKFVYYSNNNTPYGNPSLAYHYYNYLQGVWKDNSSLTYGGGGYGGTTSCSFMFPGNSDPIGWGVGGTPSSPQPQASWTESSASIAPGDRRFLQSAGPFTLLPGAVNNVTIAVVWAKATFGGPQASLQKMLTADDLVQTTFDNCFNVVGIKNLDVSKPNITIYPNPFTEQTTVSFENPNNEIYEFYLYDINGKLVQAFKDVTGDKLTILKNNLDAGTYIYELFNSRKGSSFGKIIMR